MIIMGHMALAVNPILNIPTKSIFMCFLWLSANEVPGLKTEASRSQVT